MKSILTSLIALAFAWNLNAFGNEPTAPEHQDEAATTETHTETKVAKKQTKKQKKAAKKAATKKTTTTTTESATDAAPAEGAQE